MKKMAIWTAGRPEWLRYLIVQEGPLFWNGVRWTRHRNRARFFCHNQDVAMAYRVLEQEQFKSLPLRTFEVTLNIRLRGDQDIDTNQLSSYLEDAVQILIDQQRCGTGPVPDSLVQLDVTWNEMREVQIEEGDAA